ncbi:Mu transposase C-terminal domain-containing protein [Paenibacillus sp. FSL H8-0548]|uniref:transposase family protein n=1 Tax=Paenibacillus sp. FSL H8-0548 TaxID=1920422 RepID=UPI0021161627|nr:transposase family protein [Paenibacillus sp. FSL H8-0548]
MFNELKLNMELMYFGRKYTVLSIDPPTVCLRRIEGDGESIRINFYELVTNTSFSPGKLMIKDIESQETKYRSILDALDETKREKVTFRFELIKPILVLERAKQNDIRAIYEFTQFYKEYLSENQSPMDLKQEELIERIHEKYSRPNEDGEVRAGVAVRTIKRFLAKFRLAEQEFSLHGEEALVSRAGDGHLFRTDNKQLHICHPKKREWVLDSLNVRIDEKYLPILKEVIEREFLTLKKQSKTAAYRSISIRCEAKGFDKPKKITIMKLLKRINERVTIRLREGADVASEMFDQTDRGFSNEEAQYPLHIVQIDHTQLDLDVIDDAGRDLGRPWITIGIDVFSRTVWCLYLSFEPPSANVVRKAIQHGIFFKRTKERFGTMNEWDVFGIPKIFYLDNGSDFRSIAVKKLIKETLKSHVRYRPVSTPRFGATIERLFGTINSELIHHLDGTRKSNPTELGEYDASSEAKLTLQDVRELLTHYITDIYHMDVHRGLPIDSNTPIVRYYEGLQKVGFPEFVKEEQESDFSIELLPSMSKSYTKDGVRIDNVFYKSAALSHLIDTRSTKHKVKYDDDDISHIYIMPNGTNEYVEMYASSPSADVLAGMNRFQWKMLQKNMRQESDRKRLLVPGTQQVVKAQAKLAESIQERYGKGRKARQQAARIGMEVALTPPKPASRPVEHSPKITDRFAAARKAAQERFEIEKDVN